VSADDVVVLGIAAGSVAVVGLLGLVAMHLLRRSTFRVQVLSIPVVAMLAVAVAVAVDARVMFLSAHDGGVVGLTLLVAVPLAVALAAWLGSGVARSARRLTVAAQELAVGLSPQAPHVVSAELTQVAEALAGAGSLVAEARARERAAERSRRELVARVSHDLRTPLAGIKAMAEALEDGVADDPALYLKRLQIEADRLSAMVDTLFLLSRLHAGAVRPVREPTPMHDVVSDAVASIAPTAAPAGVRLTGGAQPDAVADVDVGQVSRALVNLLANAVRHTGAGGTVHVTASRVGDEVLVAVLDGCGGIPDVDLPRLFDVGWRGQGGRSNGPDGGGGLGLAVVRGVVEAHGGCVDVRNAEAGCVFTMHLPAPGA